MLLESVSSQEKKSTIKVAQIVLDSGLNRLLPGEKWLFMGKIDIWNKRGC